MSKLVSFVRQKAKRFPGVFRALKMMYFGFTFLKNVPTAVSHIVRDNRSVEALGGEKKPKCWFLCVPSHANMGDQAMAYATRKWIHDNYPGRDIVELSRETIKLPIPDIISKMKKVMADEDIIVFQGGYTTGDKSVNEKAHRKIVKNFPGTRIVFMPQTVKYVCEKEKEITAEIYNAHGRILFLARDDISYSVVKECFSGIKTAVWPDVVSSLIGKVNGDAGVDKVRTGVLVCCRQDSEQKYSTAEIERLKADLAQYYTVDQIDLVFPREKRTADEYEKIIRELVVTMSRYRVVITDRFHGILYSLLAGTPVCTVDSIDFKVKEGSKMFAGIYPHYVMHAENVKDVVSVVKNLDSYQNRYIDDRCNKEYYEKLAGIISDL